MKFADREMPESYWKAVARRRGMKPGTYRMRRYRGMSPREAATTPVKATTPVRPNPASAESVAKEYGLAPSTILDWKYRHPDLRLSYREIAVICLANRARRAEEKAFRARCKAAGRNPNTVRRWMQEYGLSESEALQRHPKTRSQRGRANARRTKETRRG